MASRINAAPREPAQPRLADVVEQFARVKLTLSELTENADRSALEREAAALRSQLAAMTPAPVRKPVRTPLQTARELADVLQFEVAPSHRGAVGKAVTLSKQLAIAAMKPVNESLLRAQRAFNEEIVSVVTELVRASTEETPAPSAQQISARLRPLADATVIQQAGSDRRITGRIQRRATTLVAPVARELLVRQSAWNRRAVDNLEVAATSLPDVKRANALIKELALLCDPFAGPEMARAVRLTQPIWREVFRRQTHFNSEIMLAIADLLHGRPPVVPPTDADYEAFIRAFEKDDVEGARQRLRSLRNRPKISIVVPAYNTPEAVLEECINSVRAQLYPNWELCIADDGSPSSRVARTVKRFAKADPRIRFTRLEKNQGIAGATNAAIELATGEWIAFFDHDDTLAPHALAEVALRLDEDPALDWVYSDEDRLTPESERRTPFFKPDWSPELLRSVNYICHFVVCRAPLVKELRLRDGFQGSQDYDFLLRLSERTQRVAHIPKILYHWRSSDLSLSSDETRLEKASQVGIRALREHLQRCGEEGIVTAFSPTQYRVTYPVRGEPLVSIIVPFKDRPELLKTLLESLIPLTDYPHYELLLVSNNSVRPETHAYLASLTDPRIKKLEWNHPFNYPAINNFAAREAKGELLLFLNNDIEIADPKWLRELIGHAQRPQVGAVGPKLLFPDGSIQHAGVAVGINGYAAHPFWRFPDTRHMTAFGHADWNRNYLAVTSACVMLRREVFQQLQGYDEQFVLCGSDVDLGLRCVEAGLQVIYTAGTFLYHHESASRRNAPIPAKDYWKSVIAYRPWLERGDPFYNPNLSLSTTDCALRFSELSAVELAAQALLDLPS